MNASTNLITPSLESKEESKSSTSKVTSSRSSHSKVTSALVAFTLAFNVAYHASLRPKRRSYHAPTCVKTCLPIKKYLPSPSLPQVITTLEIKDSFTSRHE